MIRCIGLLMLLFQAAAVADGRANGTGNPPAVTHEEFVGFCAKTAAAAGVGHEASARLSHSLREGLRLESVQIGEADFAVFSGAKYQAITFPS